MDGCTDWVAISRSQTRDCVVNILARVAPGTCTDAPAPGDVAGDYTLVWRVACPPHPIGWMALGGDSLKHEAPPVTAPCALLGPRGLLA